jgi:hypothetical protein
MTCGRDLKHMHLQYWWLARGFELYCGLPAWALDYSRQSRTRSASFQNWANNVVNSLKMAPLALAASLTSTVTSTPILSSRYASRRKNFSPARSGKFLTIRLFFSLDPRNGRRRGRARVLQVHRLRLLLPSRANIPKDGR